MIKSSRLKLVGILLLHLFRRRYIGVFFDPILACNLRCQMCHYSNEEKRKAIHGSFKGEYKTNNIDLIAKKFFPYALKVQIGCAAEPTMDSQSTLKAVQLAKRYKVPYISLTSNANLLNEDILRELIEAGLQEVTISMHGVKQSTYEWLMEGGNYNKLLEALEKITLLKKQYKEKENRDFVLRINYTINEDNCEELGEFFSVFDKYSIDILQLRPIQRLADSKYNNFSWKRIISSYDRTIGFLREQCQKRNITIIAPTKEDLEKTINNESIVVDYTYIYISPQVTMEEGFSLQNDRFHTYRRTHGFYKNILKRIFTKNLNSSLKTKLNYEIN